jgi:hypothetical protein
MRRGVVVMDVTFPEYSVAFDTGAERPSDTQAEAKASTDDSPPPGSDLD